MKYCRRLTLVVVVVVATRVVGRRCVIKREKKEKKKAKKNYLPFGFDPWKNKLQDRDKLRFIQTVRTNNTKHRDFTTPCSYQ